MGEWTFWQRFRELQTFKSNPAMYREILSLRSERDELRETRDRWEELWRGAASERDELRETLRNGLADIRGRIYEQSDTRQIIRRELGPTSEPEIVLAMVERRLDDLRAVLDKTEEP